MKVRTFELAEKHRADLEELLYQLSGKKRHLHLARYSNVHCIGAFDDERLVGFAQLFLLPKPTFTIAHLEDVIVHTQYREQGLGAALMEEVLSTAEREGASVVQLTTRDERDVAQKLFARFGFTRPNNFILRRTIAQK